MRRLDPLRKGRQAKQTSKPEKESDTFEVQVQAGRSTPPTRWRKIRRRMSPSTWLRGVGSSDKVRRLGPLLLPSARTMEVLVVLSPCKATYSAKSCKVWVLCSNMEKLKYVVHATVLAMADSCYGNESRLRKWNAAAIACADYVRVCVCRSR